MLVLLAVLSLGRGLGWAADSQGPEEILRKYLQALKTGQFGDAYDVASAGMRQGKSKELYVKESQAMMGVADVKIFDFTVYPATVEGDKALVPNVLESQDRFINTLGLTEHELYTLVREEGAWRVDGQTLIEPQDQDKWFPRQAGKPSEQKPERAADAPSH